MLTRLSRRQTNQVHSRRKGRRTRRANRLTRFEQLEQRLLLTVYTSSDVPKAIPDQDTVTSTLTVPDAVTVGDINATLDITHKNDQDLDVFLIAPDGTRVELFTDVGGGGDHFTGTTLDDEAATPITAGSAPFSGSKRHSAVPGDRDVAGNHGAGKW